MNEVERPFFTVAIDYAIQASKYSGYWIGYFLFTYLELPLEALGLLLLISGFDILTGILKSYMIAGGVSVTSNRFTIGVIKKILIFSAVLIFASAMAANNLSSPALLQSIVGVFCIGEAYSAIGNCYSGYSKKELPEFDAISFILKSLSRWLQVALEKILEKPKL